MSSIDAVLSRECFGETRLCGVVWSEPTLPCGDVESAAWEASFPAKSQPARPKQASMAAVSSFCEWPVGTVDISVKANTSCGSAAPVGVQPGPPANKWPSYPAQIFSSRINPCVSTVPTLSNSRISSSEFGPPNAIRNVHGIA